MAQLATLVTKYDPAQAEAMSGGTGDGATAISLSGAAAAVEEPDEELPRYLIIGDQDHTETLVKCLNESGYQPPVYQQDPAEELRQKEKTAKDTAEWAKCARENGYPGITDPDPPKADEWQTSPSVTLPGDITEDALRALITACPTFDPEAQKAFDDKLEALGNNPNSTEADWSKIWEESPSSPQIEFDIPGMNGEGAQPEEADWERINKLYEILWEQQNAYDEAQSFATAAPAAG
jgi:hypothetical protein